MSEFTVRPVRRRKLYEEIVEHLEQMMFKGKLAPGDLLPSERELMEMFGVGRPSVREALFALQRMGLVAVRNGERAYVTRPSAERLVRELSGAARHFLAHPEGVREFQQARRMLECLMARHAAEQADDTDIAELAAALAENERAMADSFEEFARTDVAFHFRITQISGNSLFIAMHTAAVEWLSEQRLATVKAKGSMQDAFAAHQKIFNAIADHRPEEAAQAMATHLDQVVQYYWESRRTP
ncbi:transcriptional regulator NanR [Geminicoccus harenae]|uniref:transcriptional regulator NanR n=1 Tax=Geminicoccus harenae TaxID=2498453 RepID=UPI00168A73A7|nr:transcriptional regulator NanR [Geminicoccus harenae]